MKITKKHSIYKILIIGVVLIFTSCNKDTEQENTEFEITSVSEINDIYAKQEAFYKFSLPSGEYKIKVKANDGDLSSTYLLNGTENTLGNIVNLSGGEFKISIIPNEVGTAVFTIEITKGDFVKVISLNLNSKKPEFTITASFDSEQISVGGATYLHITVFLLDNYDKNLTYNYSIRQPADIDLTIIPRVINSVIGTPTPSIQNVLIKGITAHASPIPIVIVVENEFGFFASLNTSITVQ